MLFSYAAWHPLLGSHPVGPDLGIVFLSAIFFAVSRDNLRRYYGRAAVLLGPLDKEFTHEQRSRSSRFDSIWRRREPAHTEDNPKKGGHAEGD